MKSLNEQNESIAKKLAEQEEARSKNEYEKLKEKSKGIVELNSRERHVPDYLL